MLALTVASKAAARCLVVAQLVLLPWQDVQQVDPSACKTL